MKRLSCLVVLAVMFTACGHQPPNVTPQASIAHYGTDVIESVNAVQALVIRASSGQPPLLPVAQATPVMNKIRAVLLNAQKLSEALKAYDAALGPDRQAKGQQVVALLNLISAANLGSITAGLPSALVAEATRLVGNVTTTIATVKASLAASHISMNLERRVYA